MLRHDYKTQRVDELVFLGRNANQQHGTGYLRRTRSWIYNSLLRFLSYAFQAFGRSHVLGFPYFHNSHQNDLLWVDHLADRVWYISGLGTAAPEKQARPSTFCQ
jgi:hypothetical protein